MKCHLASPGATQRSVQGAFTARLPSEQEELLLAAAALMQVTAGAVRCSLLLPLLLPRTPLLKIMKPTFLLIIFTSFFSCWCGSRQFSMLRLLGPALPEQNKLGAQELEKLGLRDGVDLHVYEVPVEYQTVQRLIPALWKKHSPQLVVHVGVSGMATTVTLEKCGHNVGYKGLDNCRFCPGSQCCVEGGPECIDSIIDMDLVCRRVSALGLDVTVTISKDAGRYLCDFTYYTSLYQSCGRSAFVHVPPLGKPYSAEQLGRALQAIIEEMLDVLEHSEDKINCQHEH
uniref:Pyroglutamyl-peptidase I n=1 Tax=Gallus gallus TaxID=9031 RepID=A0A8V1A8F9_CHICK